MVVKDSYARKLKLDGTNMKISLHFIVSCLLGSLVGATILVILGPTESVLVNCLVGAALGLPIFFADSPQAQRLMNPKNIQRAYQYVLRAAVWGVVVTLICGLFLDVTLVGALSRGVVAGVIIATADVFIDRKKRTIGPNGTARKTDPKG